MPDIEELKRLKMYVLVKDTVPLGHAINSVGHATVACYIKFQDSPVVIDWLEHSFRKVTCKVTQAQFDEAKLVADHVVITESALGGEETVVVFKPRDVWPEQFRYYPLYK